MTITLSDHARDGYVEITASGRITEEDMNRVLPQLEDIIKKYGKIRVVEVIAGFEGYDTAAIWKGLAFEQKHLRDITHVAVVCDKGWMGPVSRALGALMPLTLRTFTSHDRDKARAWASNPSIEVA